MPRRRRRPSSASSPAKRIQVETAIRAIVTKSANDVAVIVAEALGGDETSFAKLMTAKARALGMKHTTYHNASGLPDDQQITTARDQAILGRAIQDRFPNYLSLFLDADLRVPRQGDAQSQSSARQRRRRRRHQDRLYPRFRIQHRHLGSTAATAISSPWCSAAAPPSARDARVRSLIDNNINVAAVKRTAPPIVEGWETVEPRPRTPRTRTARPDAGRDPRAAQRPRQIPSRKRRRPARPIRSSPIAVKTFTVHPGSMRTASLSPLPSDSRKLTPAPATANAASVTTIATVKSDTPACHRRPAQNRACSACCQPTASQVASAGDSGAGRRRAAAVAAAKPRGGGWMIQVGAFPDEKEAKQRLDRGAKQGQGPARPGRPVHRTGDEGRQVALPRALCRPREGSGGNRLQTSQAQRNSLHAAEKLTPDRAKRKTGNDRANKTKKAR